MSWRDRARPIIAAALVATAGQEEKAIRRALRDAYPFGLRQHWPYKVWLDEIARQRGRKPPIGRRAVFSRDAAGRPTFVDPRQMELLPS